MCYWLLHWQSRPNTEGLREFISYASDRSCQVFNMTLQENNLSMPFPCFPKGDPSAKEHSHAGSA